MMLFNSSEAIVHRNTSPSNFVFGKYVDSIFKQESMLKHDWKDLKYSKRKAIKVYNFKNLLARSNSESTCLLLKVLF